MKYVKNRESLLQLIPKNLVCVELGVLSGVFSDKILKYLEPKELYLVDHFTGLILSGDHNGENVKEYDMNFEYEKLQMLYKSQEFIKFKKCYSKDALKEFSDNYLDFVYIDTDHTFNTTFEELELSFHKLKDSGFLCGHDYSEIHFPECKKAVDLFCSTYNQKIECLTIEDKMPSFLIKVKKSGKGFSESLYRLIIDKEYSLISPSRFENLKSQIDYVKANGIEGDIVETGVWRGGVIIFLAKYLNYINHTAKVIACDSFQGLPEPGEEDFLHTGEHSSEMNFSILNVSKESFLKNLKEFNIKESDLEIYEGWFEDTLHHIPNKISILRMDGDYYESTMDTLEALYDKITPGGVLLIDDYLWFKGCKKAVHDFIEKRGIDVKINLTENDNTEAWFIKK
jgi:O-methyltransferase